MLSKTIGIIFRSMKYRETSLILDIYTQDLGLQSYIISGIRSKKSKTKTGLLQIPNMVELIAYHKGKGTLQRIKEVKSHRLYSSIPFEISKSSLCLFLAEICQKTIKEEEPNPKLFNFLKESFLFLDQSKDSIANFHLLFLCKLSETLGFRPSNNYSSNRPIFDLEDGMFKEKGDTTFHYLDESLSGYLSRLLHIDYYQMHEFQIPKAERLRLLDNLIDFYQIHVETFGTVKSLPILKEILG